MAEIFNNKPEGIDVSMNEIAIYQQIADAVVKSAPASWVEIIVSAEIHDDHGKALYDYVDGEGVGHWFAPDTMNQHKVYTAFSELKSFMTANGRSWINAKFTLKKNGDFQIHFD